MKKRIMVEILMFITQAVLQADGNYLAAPNIDYIKELFSFVIEYIWP